MKNSLVAFRTEKALRDCAGTLFYISNKVRHFWRNRLTLEARIYIVVTALVVAQATVMITVLK